MKILRMAVCAAALLCAVTVALTTELQAQTRVEIVKKGSSTLRVAGFTGSQTAARQFNSDLKLCGWFDVVTTGSADYVVSGSASAAGVTVSVSKKGGAVYTLTQPMVVNERETIHKIVDQLLSKEFGIKGLCSYKIAFAAEVNKRQKNIWICDFDGSNVQRIVTSPVVCTEPEWVPGGERLVFTLYAGSHTNVAEVDIRSKYARRLAQYPGMNADPYLSPRRNAFAFLMSRDGNVELYLHAYGTRSLTRLTNTRGTEGTPCFSPDGNQVAFVSDEGSMGRTSLYRVGVNGGKISKVPVTGSNPTKPDWSLDNKLVYAAATSQGNSICVTDLSGQMGNGTGIVIGGGYESPSWAPDNRHIVCQQVTRGRTTLWVVDTWTGKRRLLLNSKLNLSVPAWQKF